MRRPPDPVLYLWAKSNEAIRNSSGKKVGENPNTWVPLLAHLLDVAACVTVVLERDEDLMSTFAEDFGLEPEAVVPWVAALGGLHDIGKAFPMFQLKWKFREIELGRDLIQKGGFTWSPSDTDGKEVYHAVVSQVVLEKLLHEIGFARETACKVSDAIGAHHGFSADSNACQKARYRLGNEGWTNARKTLFELVLEATGASALDVPSTEELSAEAFMRFAGLVSFCDWIGSNRRWFDAGRAVEDVGAFYRDSCSRAEGALEDIGWPKREVLLPTFTELFGFEPRDLQTVTANLLQTQTEPTLLLIEAPMGEGKTEAAFYGHLLLQHNVGHRGFYIALPTQATGNAMFKRVKDKFLSKLGYTQAPDLQLLHGAAILDKNLEGMRLQIGGTPDDTDTVVAREWFSQKKQGLLSPHAVGTVDQALMSVLNVSHQFVRLYGLSNRTIILDEIHAYEVYTSTLIERLIKWLKAMDSSVILLSATLPKSVRSRLTEAYGGAAPTDDKPYPRITKVDSTKAVVESLQVQKRTYQLAEAPHKIAELARFLIEQSEGGGAVGCIVNTVQRAQDLYKEIAALGVGVPVRLIHARVPAYKRRTLERWASRFLGKYHKEQRNVIVIGTQLLEQSLDIDFDMLISDLAPIDLLLQRAGRLHRHKYVESKDFGRLERPRPVKHQVARLYVAGLQPHAEKPEISEFYWDYVYAPAVLYRTWAVIKDRNGKSLRLPDDFQDTAERPSLLEQVYSAEPLSQACPEAFLNVLSDAEKKLAEKLKVERDKASRVAVPTPQKFFDQLPSDDKREDTDDPGMNVNLRAVTRLGDPSVLVVFLHQRDGALFLSDDTPIDLKKKPTFSEAKKLLQNAVLIGNQTVFWHLLDKPIHAWQKSSLLRYARAIKLEDGVYTVSSKFKMRLDEVLGVVYDRSK